MTDTPSSLTTTPRPPSMTNPKVILYTWTICPYCVRAKDLLKKKGIPFMEINLDGQEAELEALRKKTNWRTLPQIFINDEFIGGYTDLAQLEAQGELEKKLQGPSSQP